MAARGLNSCTFIGNLGADPISRTTKNKRPYTTFRIAVTEAWNGKDHTEWVRIVAWGELARVCAEHLKEGRQVSVVAKFREREWTDKENRKQKTWEFEAREVIFLDGGGRPPSSP